MWKTSNICKGEKKKQGKEYIHEGNNIGKQEQWMETRETELEWVDWVLNCSKKPT